MRGIVANIIRGEIRLQRWPRSHGPTNSFSTKFLLALRIQIPRNREIIFELELRKSRLREYPKYVYQFQ